MTAVGSVVLSLPQAFAECGWLGGCLVLCLVAALADASLRALVDAARLVGEKTYEAAGEALLGPRGGALVRVSLVVLLFGSLVSLQIIVADELTPVAEALLVDPRVANRHHAAGALAGGGANATSPSAPFSPPARPFFATREGVTLASFAATFPMTLAPDVRSLAAASTAAFAVLLFVGGVAVFAFAEDGFAVASDVRATAFDRPSGVALAVPVVALAFTCHFNVVEIAAEMTDRAERQAAADENAALKEEEEEEEDAAEDAAEDVGLEEAPLSPLSPRSIRSASRSVHDVSRVAVFGGALPFYLVFAGVGYARFGSRVSGDALEDWGEDAWTTASRVAVAGVNVLKYPLVGFGLRRMTEAFVSARQAPERLVAGAGGGEGGADGGADDDALEAALLREEGYGGTAAAVEGAAVSSDEGGAAPPPPFRETAAALFALHAAVAACAVGLRSLQLALDLVGATFGVLVAFVLPGVLALAAAEERARRAREADVFFSGAAAVGAAAEAEARRASRVERATGWALIVAGAGTSACGMAAVAAELAG
jgi:amino acid permease